MANQVKKYFKFMGVVWSIPGSSYDQLVQDIKQLGYVPDVAGYGAREVKRAPVPAYPIEPERRRTE